MTELIRLSAVAGQLLKDTQQTIAVAESSTAGLISAALLAVPGASAYYKGGTVIYTLESRRELLGISRDDVAGLEPLTKEMVLQFARRARAQLDADWGIAELGVAGPAGSRYGHPAGVSVLAVAGPTERATLIETHDEHRERNMWAFTGAALELLEETLQSAASE